MESQKKRQDYKFSILTIAAQNREEAVRRVELKKAQLSDTWNTTGRWDPVRYKQQMDELNKERDAIDKKPLFDYLPKIQPTSKQIQRQRAMIRSGHRKLHISPRMPSLSR